MKDVAVIILNYKTWEDTVSEIETLHDIVKIPYDDIIIVDNNSPNDSVQNLIEVEGKGVKLLVSEENKGYAAGNNIGIKYAEEKQYKYAWIINNDIIIKDSDVLNKMLEVLRKENELAVVNPDIYAPDGHLYNRDSKRFTFFDLTLGMLLYRKKGRTIVDRGGYGYIYRPQGCCMLLDIEKSKEVGYLDENTFLYSEEIIYAERLLEKGYTVACCSNTSVIHNHSTTVKTSLDRKKLINIQIESFKYYLSKYRKFSKFKIKVCLLFYKLKLKCIS